MSTTTAELSLSPAFRLAQRTLACWLERGHVGARQAAFAVRAVLSGLDAAERGRIARWLAWLEVAAHSRGLASPEARIRRLDASLHQAMQDAFRRLPGQTVVARTGNHRRRA
ncbi:hypothetical protein [Dyella japonica]|uniref:Uncharacterized protein n=1 Tax=Dyella japonica A8 TaxID=1217721 RepID=A0A075JV46_9GAMM|nr:hypothetical protein [Dyella japonica]AIF45779.1 hypothetical protein HY57_00125 [Dyella japonica A8]